MKADAPHLRILDNRIYLRGTALQCCRIKLVSAARSRNASVPPSFGGIGPNYVCIGQTVLKFRSCQKLVDEPGCETISGANIIHGLHSRGHEAVLLLPGPANGCGSAAFHDYNLR
jgi:hypothetical protein